MTETGTIMRTANPRSRLLTLLKRMLTEDCASQIVEFALSLPLLTLFVVGIFDFSGAISPKQKLTNAAREGARVAAADPATDMGSSTVPASVADAFQVVDNYLLSENIADCGLSMDEPVKTTGLTWVSTATASPCGGISAIVLTINRGCKSQITSGANTINLIETCVTIQYPYKWQYNSVAGLVGGRFTGPTSITTTATAFNEN
jgi:Flp pilus assembly protein TadG